MPRRKRAAPNNETLPIGREIVGVERQWILLAAAALFCLVFFVFAGGYWAMALYRLLSDGFLLLLWLTACAGVGHWLLKPFRQASLTTAAALGVGAFSLVLLALGLLGILNRPTAWGLIIAGLAAAALAWRDVGVTTEDFTTALRETVPHSDWLWLLIVPFVAIGVIAAFMPPGILWGMGEPNGYDVVEYHLQVPREWFELGRIVALRHNVFSFFPFNVELHYLWAMNLRGGPWAGMYLAQLMHLALMVLSVAAIYEFVGRKGLLGVLIAAATPWLTMLGSIAYNEGGVLLFGTLSIIWAIRSLDDLPNRRRLMALAGVFAGLACGVKLTAVPMLLIFIPIAYGIALAARHELKSVARPLLIFAACGLAVASPWFVRNLVWARNPVFPEAMSIFGHGHFSPDQVKRWQLAYVPPQSDFVYRVMATKDQIFTDWRFGFALFPAAAVVLVLVIRRRRAMDGPLIMCVSLLVLWLGLWVGFTHLQGRFFVLAIPVAALMIARVEEPLGRLVVTCALLVQVGFGLLGMSEPIATHLNPWIAKGALGVESYGNEAEKGDVWLIGDAGAFIYPTPTQRLHYRTVFDVDVRGRSLIDAWADGRAAKEGDVVKVSYDELARFHRTYFGIPSPPAPPPDPTTSPVSGTP